MFGPLPMVIMAINKIAAEGLLILVMKNCCDYQTTKTIHGFVNHEGMVLTAIISILAAILLAIASRTGSETLKLISIFLFVLVGIAFGRSFWRNVSHKRRPSKQTGESSNSNSGGQKN